jgi:hypothetical protein
VRGPARPLVFMLSCHTIARTDAWDVGATAAACVTSGCGLLGLSYFRVPLMLNALLPPESAFAVKQCDSPTKGRGLFAMQAFAASSLVIEYRGDVLSWKSLAERYGSGKINLQGKYVFELRELAVYIDAADERSAGCARFINHSSRNPNLRVEVDLLHSRAWFVASREIAAGDELCFDYGSRYWEGWEGGLIE